MIREHKHTWAPNKATGQYVCTQPGCHCVRIGVLDLHLWTMAARIDVWNRAMRNATSRRKFIRTGEA
jgi:hypothetical protein